MLNLSVSVAMATYNGADYIRAQLDSLATQTFLPCELVVTDDGSSDATLKIIAEFASSAPFPVRVYRNVDRLGYGDNFMKAASLCSGRLVAFCDQDDIWDRRKLELCERLFSDPEVVMTSHNAVGIDGWGRPLSEADVVHRVADGVSFEKKFWSNCLGFTIMFDLLRLKNVPMLLRPFRDFGLQHDEYIYFICTSLGKIGFVTNDLVKYRRHGLNASGPMDSKARPDNLARLQHGYAGLRRRCLMMAAVCNTVPGQNRSGRVVAPFVAAYYLRRRILVLQSRSVWEGLCRLARNMRLGVYGDGPRVGLGRRALAVDFLSICGALAWIGRASMRKSHGRCSL